MCIRDRSLSCPSPSLWHPTAVSYTHLDVYKRQIATQAREVLGVEGSAALVARSCENLASNRAQALVNRSFCTTHFVARNLFEMTPTMLVADGVADKWLVDPPREGAFALVTALADLHQQRLGTSGFQPTVGANPVSYTHLGPSNGRDCAPADHRGCQTPSAGCRHGFPRGSPEYGDQADSAGCFRSVCACGPRQGRASPVCGLSAGSVSYTHLDVYKRQGFMREQVCLHMCPYARFQSAMFDKDTLIVTYDTERGEPRGPRSKKADPAKLNLGACVDCSLCVQVCPTGIDIRNGLQYQCIGCGACADVCDTVMDKVGYARGLVKYSTENAMENHLSLIHI